MNKISSQIKLFAPWFNEILKWFEYFILMNSKDLILYFCKKITMKLILYNLNNCMFQVIPSFPKCKIEKNINSLLFKYLSNFSLSKIFTFDTKKSLNSHKNSTPKLIMKTHRKIFIISIYIYSQQN